MIRRSLSIGGIVAALSLLAMVATAASATTTTTTTPAPGALLLYAVNATKGEQTVHFEATSVDQSESTTLTADVSQLGYGQFNVVIHVGRATGHVTGRYVGNAVYFKGDAVGFGDYLGFSTSQTRAYAGKWVKISSTNAGFSSLVTAFTLQAAVAEVSINQPWANGPRTTINGVRALGVRGTWKSLTVSGKSGPAVLFVSAQSAHLPIRLSVQSAGAHPASHGEVTFSHWNERFRVSAPSSATPFV